MKVLWVQAHPEPQSFNSYLATEGQRALRVGAHQVEVSDLYAMGFNPIVDGASYAHDPAERFQVAAAAKLAYEDGALPAILKGWFDRVWHQGFAYGIPGPNGEWIGYGDGFLAGKRAMAVVTMGGPAWFYGERGIHGYVQNLLFPLQHGILFYAGAEVVPPVLISGADRYTPQEGETAARKLGERLLAIPTTEPIAYRTLNGGDYDENLVLRPAAAPGLTGLGAHVS